MTNHIKGLNKSNIEERIIWVDDDIDDNSLEYSKWIIEWNRQDNLHPDEVRKPIRLLFFCYGGNLDVNNVLIDTISLSTTPIIGVNIGEALSAGCFIFLACHERYTFPKAQFLIHRGSGMFEGTYDIIMSQIIQYQQEMEKLEEYILKRTKIPKKLFEKNFANEWYLSADEAIKYGIASRKIENLDEIFDDENYNKADSE